MNREPSLGLRPAILLPPALATPEAAATPRVSARAAVSQPKPNLGTPRRDASGAIVNGVLLLHGTAGSAADLAQAAFFDALYSDHQLHAEADSCNGPLLSPNGDAQRR
jgi:hypothetical protein